MRTIERMSHWNNSALVGELETEYSHICLAKSVVPPQSIVIPHKTAVHA